MRQFGTVRVQSRDCMLLTLLCLALYVPGLTTIPPVDRDEARFAQATKQMLQTGDLVLPHFGSENRFNKPIGIYWLQAAAVLITAGRESAAIWPYRVPSVFGAIGAVLLTYWAGRRLFDRHVALLGAAFLGSSVLLIVEAHLATTDAVLLACVVAAQSCLAALYTAGRRGHIGARSYAAGFWIAQGIGVLIKGPIVLLVSGLTVGVLLGLEHWRGGEEHADSNRRLLVGLRWRWGPFLTLAISAPWIAAAGWATHGAFYSDWMVKDVISKAVGAQESHGALPGLYLLLAVVTFWPASFAAALGFVRGLGRHARTGERFCLAWLIPTWLFFELMPTKLPHYVLPAYPALALLAARAALATRPGSLRPSGTRALRAGFGLWSGVTVLLGALVLVASARLGNGLGFASLVVAAATALTAFFCVRLCWRGQLAQASTIAVISSVVVFVPLLQWVLPDLGSVWLSRAASAAVARQPRGRDAARPIAAVGYQEPSLVFLAATDVALIEPQEAASFLRERTDGLVLVSENQRAAFTRAAIDIGLSVHEVWAMDGINYSQGRRTRLSLFEQVTPSTASATWSK
jgi:4-amino-4-deoxy-L-arabinose transferase-like glycosyltransferase